MLFDLLEYLPLPALLVVYPAVIEKFLFDFVELLSLSEILRARVALLGGIRLFGLSRLHPRQFLCFFPVDVLLDLQHLLHHLALAMGSVLLHSCAGLAYLAVFDAGRVPAPLLMRRLMLWCMSLLSCRIAAWRCLVMGFIVP